MEDGKKEECFKEKAEESSQEKKLRLANHPDPTSLLTDDLIVEILSRLPARPVHRFKCVSTSWRDLIAHPSHRKKLPQTLAGIFFGGSNLVRRAGPTPYYYVPVPIPAAPQVDASLPFLPNDRAIEQLVDICNGLLLLRCCNKGTPSASADENEFRYIVCNPATGRWVELPPHPPAKARQAWVNATHLGFDPAVSSHFHVFEFERPDQGTHMSGVNIYSSQSGVWDYKQSRLDRQIITGLRMPSVFANGMLHLFSMVELVLVPNFLLAVDTEGKVWKTIRMPRHRAFSVGSIGLSQGSLLSVNIIPTPIKEGEKNTVLASEIAVWCLEGYDNKDWVLKRSVRADKLFRMIGNQYRMCAIHPDCEIVFLVSWDNTILVSYDLRHEECYRINLEDNAGGPYLPYTPLFSESLADADGH